MAKKKVWTSWRLTVGTWDFIRTPAGYLDIYHQKQRIAPVAEALPPRGVRRLFQKLSSDYRD